MTRNRSFQAYLSLILLGMIALLGLNGLGFTQIEADRGIAPINSSGDFEVEGITVNATGKNAEEARLKGWREAQRKGWQALWQRSNRGGAAPALSDSRLSSIVSGIVIEREQIGPRRYIASLGILFDRARAGAILGVRSTRLRSAPLLVVPVMISGGSEQVFEYRTPWQRAWANFRTADSTIDYVRPSGAGSDSLLLTAGQTGRRDRNWWRLILDQFGAADVLIPVVRVERLYPGGPATGYFTAYFGPDRARIGSFELTAADSDGLAAMLTEGVERMDTIYRAALSRGDLRPDTSLIIEDSDEDALEDELEELEALEDDAAEEDDRTASEEAAVPAAPAVTSIAVQYSSPDVGSVNSAEAAVRGIAGVRSASTSSLALGGTSVMSVQFDGDAAQLRQQLEARGWRVQQSGNTLRISR
ncbi:MAG: heavy-metal-associated domain-containing protein [Pseudomonadota bacterium]